MLFGTKVFSVASVTNVRMVSVAPDCQPYGLIIVVWLIDTPYTATVLANPPISTKVIIAVLIHYFYQRRPKPPQT